MWVLRKKHSHNVLWMFSQLHWYDGDENIGLWNPTGPFSLDTSDGPGVSQKPLLFDGNADDTWLNCALRSSMFLLYWFCWHIINMAIQWERTTHTLRNSTFGTRVHEENTVPAHERTESHWIRSFQTRVNPLHFYSGSYRTDPFRVASVIIKRINNANFIKYETEDNRVINQPKNRLVIN